MDVTEEGHPGLPGDEPLGEPEAADVELPQLSDSDIVPDQEPAETPPEEPEPQDVESVQPIDADGSSGSAAVTRLAPQSNDRQVRPRLDSAEP